MGKSSRKLKSDQKKRLKKLAKAAKRALYASYAGTGRRHKKSAAAGATPQRGNHVMSNCGNVGCERCYPQHRVLLASGRPREVVVC